MNKTHTRCSCVDKKDWVSTGAGKFQPYNVGSIALETGRKPILIASKWLAGEGTAEEFKHFAQN